MPNPASTAPTTAGSLSNQRPAAARSPVLSDYLLLGSLALALLIVDDPYVPDLQYVPSMRHLPLMLALLSILLASVGDWLRPARARLTSRGWPVVKLAFPLVVLALWILCGSTYAHVSEGIKNTFLNTGTYMMITLLAARFIVLSDARDRVLVLAARTLAVSAAYMIVRMLAEQLWTGGRYHELEFMVVPVAVYFALSPAFSGSWKRLLVLFFLAGGVVFCKNTGFIVMGITLVYLWWADWRFQLRKPRLLYRVIFGGTVAATLVLCATVMFGQTIARHLILPDGNPGYRVRAYDKAIARFEASPVWGDLFAASSTSRFVAYDIDQGGANGELPTHSDVLDFAANGGLIGLGLLTWAYVRVGRLSLRTVLSVRGTGARRSDAEAAAHMFACMSVAGIAVYAFNPIMLQPDKALLLWMNLGLLLGLGLHRAARQRLNLEPSR